MPLKITALDEAEFFAFVVYMTMRANPQIPLHKFEEIQAQAGMDELSFQIGIDWLVEHEMLQYSNQDPYH